MEKGKKILFNIVSFSITFIILIFIKNEKNEEDNLISKSYFPLPEEEVVNGINEEIVETKYYLKEEIIDVYNGYRVCAKLEIPAISLETYVLEDYSEEALNISVVKFWGVEPNQIGNFCIAGHNFINKNMFKNLKKLNLKDKLFITDREIGKVEYEVFKIDTVLPEDIDCLEAITNNEKEVTLITCTIDSKKRIIIKAKEIK